MIIIFITPSGITALPQTSNNPIDINQNTYAIPETIKQQDIDKNLFIDENAKATTSDSYNLPTKLRDNVNSYTQVWNPWVTKAGVHVSAVSDDGDFMAVGGGYLIDTTVHIYRWNLDLQQYDKVWEAGSGIIQGDIYDIAWADLDNNKLLDLIVASADGRIYVFEQAHIYDPFTSLDSKFDLVWKSEKLFQISSVEVADLDLDNIPDLIAGSWDGSVHIYEYTSNSGYPFSKDHWMKLEEKWVSEKLDDKIQALDYGDINNNGLPDIVVGTLSGSIFVFENDGIIVPTGTGGTAPFPNDNNYRQLWNSSGKFSPIWNMIGQIESGELDNRPGTEAVILGWGQGSWVLSYGTRGFELEQMIKPFESWQTQGVYPLDNWADFMLDTSGDNAAYNVLPDASRVASGSYPSCDANVKEPTLEGYCYTVNVNSGASEAPDSIYTRFVANGTHGARAVWNIGVGEEIATNGNQDADVYVVMKKNTAIKTEWNISISDDLSNWFSINQSQISVINKIAASTLALDLDPTFALNKLTKAQYIKIEMIKKDNGYTREIDAIVVPYVAQPLTLAVSTTIDQLYFDFEDQRDQVEENNKIIFGASDGRLIVYNYEAINSISYRNPASLGNFLNFYKSTYGIRLPVYSQTWDSFTDDQFNLKDTIWSIQKTKKTTFIPSWRYIATGDDASPNFSVSGFGFTEKVHHLNIKDFSPYILGKELVVTTNRTNRPDNNLVMIYDQITQAESFGGAATDTHFSNVNSYYNLENKIITTVFGDFVKDSFGEEMITFPWYQDPQTLNVTYRAYDEGLFPTLWEDDGSGVTTFWGLKYPGKYVKSALQFNDLNAGFIEDRDKLLYSFLDDSTTYPSATARDIDNDGDIDIILSNGRLALLRNIASPSDLKPSFELDTDYFDNLNEIVPSQPIYSPQAWDYDRDGDFDILYSYGISSDSNHRYGLDFFKNKGSDGDADWERVPEMVKNPTAVGGLKFNEFTYGVVEKSTSKSKSASSLWVYKPTNNYLRKLYGETGTQTSFMIGTNPEVMKLEVNKLNSEPNYINFGYTITDSWTNSREFEDWTLTLTTGTLDGDNNNEIIVSDFDNNVYVFEHLTNNTYKRAFKSHNLNHTEETNKSPYRFQDLPGIDGNFEKVVFDHGNLLATGVDSDKDGNLEFIVTAALSIYIFEATGFNDEYSLMYESDIGKIKNKLGIKYNQLANEFSAITVADDFDSRGSMIALSTGNILFLLRYDPVLGWLESFQSIDGIAGMTGIVGDPDFNADVSITTLLFADANQDGNTELWIGGTNTSSTEYFNDAFLLAIQSEYGNLHKVFTFPSQLTDKNSLNRIKISNDIDADGNLEIVIAHKSGIDIWEVAKGTGFVLSQQEVISSDPSYGSDILEPTFGTYQSEDGLAARRNDLLRLSNGQYVVVYGNESSGYRSFEAPFTGANQLGVLRFALSSNPSNVGNMKDNNRVSTEIYDVDQILYSYTTTSYKYKLLNENEPSIVQNCFTGCGGNTGSFYIGWIASYEEFNLADVSTGKILKRYMVQRFQIDGSKIGSSKVLASTRTDKGIAGPGLAVDPNNNQKVMYTFVLYNRIYNYFIEISDIGTLTISKTDTAFSMKLFGYAINSADIINNPGTSQVNSYGIIFSGYAFNATYKINQLHYASFDDQYKLEGVYKIDDSKDIESVPSIVMKDGGKIIVMYEKQKNGANTLSTVYSSDNGRTWSDNYILNTDSPLLTQTGISSFTTENDKAAVLRKLYRPRLTLDGNGGIKYHFVERFLVISDPNYSVNPFYLGYYFATQLHVGGMSTTNWFKYDGITDVTDFALGDSDLDNRPELLIAHQNKVTLLELESELNGKTVHGQKWQSKEYDRNVGSVAIFDANGNEWPELIFSVKGGEVFAFELTDTSQIKAGDIFLSKNNGTLDVNIAGIKSTNNLVSDTNNDGKLDLLVASENIGQGVIRWNIDSNTLLGSTPLEGTTTNAYSFDDARGKGIVIITDKAVRGYNYNMEIQYTKSLLSPFKYHTSLLVDVNDDGLKELIILDSTKILALNPIDGSEIWSNTAGAPNSAKYYDLITYTRNSRTYFGISDSDLSSYRLFKLLDINGTLINEFQIPFSSDYNTTTSIGDYDNDGKIDLAVLRVNPFGYSSIKIYTLDDNDLTSEENLIANITVPIQGLSMKEPLSMYTENVNGKGGDELIFAIPEINQTIISEINLPDNAVSGVIAIDVTTESVIWERIFSNKLINFEIQNIGGSNTLFAYIKNDGVFALTLSGKDLFWLESNENPMSADYFGNDYFAVTDYTGKTIISKIEGVITPADPMFTIKQSYVKSNTKYLYKVSDNINDVNMFVYPVDVTGNDAEDILVGFTNGTIALRNYEIGEYWRIDTGDFDMMIASSVEYAKNKYGVVVNTYPGRLMIFDRITSNIVLNISNDIGGEIDMMYPFADGEYDSILLQTKNNILSVIDPVVGSYIWNDTSSVHFQYIETGFFDADNPNVNTHIIGLDDARVAHLIPLPSTLINGGLYPSPVSGGWVDIFNYKQSNGLTATYLVSENGEILHMKWKTDGTIDQYNTISLATNVNSFDVSQITGDIIMSSSSDGVIRLHDNGTAINIVSAIDITYQGNFDNRLLDIDNDGDVESVVIMGNQIAIFEKDGSIIETHSFSSVIIDLYFWKPEVNNEFAYLTVLADGDVQVSDPHKRNLGSYIAPIDHSIEFGNIGKEITIILPDAIWTEYVPNSGDRNFNPVFFISILSMITLVVLIVKAKYRK